MGRDRSLRRGVPVGEPITPLFNGSKVLPFARLLHEDRAAGVSPESSDSLLEEIAASPLTSSAIMVKSLRMIRS